jgi:hypothetical protein
MALPGSGAISFSQINTEVGVPTTTTRDLNWVRSNTYYGHTNLNSLRNYLWFFVHYTKSIGRTTTTTTTNCVQNCGDIQYNAGYYYMTETNCDLINNKNCNQCSFQTPFLQANCNCVCNCFVCNCIYNNCDCNCLCGDG